VPTAPVSVAVALADKLDTLTGFWAIDEKPTGSKDPFALRRAALGVIRLILENRVRMQICATTEVSFAQTLVALYYSEKIVTANEIVELRDEGVHDDIVDDARERFEGSVRAYRNDDTLEFARDLYGGSLDDFIKSLLAFFHDRLKVYLKDQGVRHDVIDACIAMPCNDDLALLVKRATALSDFLKTEDGGNLLQGFKRANNILTQAEDNDGVEYSYGADVKFAETDEERTLFAALKGAEPVVAAAVKSEDFAAVMAALAGLRAPIDAFFDAVQVNANSQIVRRNRLNMLGQIRKIGLAAADLTRIEG
jgi:glycyl-tRNA synthetase beta chain